MEQDVPTTGAEAWLGSGKQSYELVEAPVGVSTTAAPAQPQPPAAAPPAAAAPSQYYNYRPLTPVQTTHTAAYTPPQPAAPPAPAPAPSGGGRYLDEPAPVTASVTGAAWLPHKLWTLDWVLSPAAPQPPAKNFPNWLERRESELYVLGHDLRDYMNLPEAPGEPRMLGVFAKTTIPAGSWLAEYMGNSTPTENSCYVYSLPDDRRVAADTEESSNWSRYVNAPAHGVPFPFVTDDAAGVENCMFINRKSADGRYHAYLCARREIPPGKELLVPYGTHSCCAEICGWTIKRQAQLDALVRKRFVIPLVNKWMQNHWHYWCPGMLEDCKKRNGRSRISESAKAREFAVCKEDIAEIQEEDPNFILEELESHSDCPARLRRMISQFRRKRRREDGSGSEDGKELPPAANEKPNRPPSQRFGNRKTKRKPKVLEAWWAGPEPEANAEVILSGAIGGLVALNCLRARTSTPDDGLNELNNRSLKVLATSHNINISGMERADAVSVLRQAGIRAPDPDAGTLVVTDTDQEVIETYAALNKLQSFSETLEHVRRLRKKSQRSRDQRSEAEEKAQRFLEEFREHLRNTSVSLLTAVATSLQHGGLPITDAARSHMIIMRCAEVAWDDRAQRDAAGVVSMVKVFKEKVAAMRAR